MNFKLDNQKDDGGSVENNSVICLNQAPTHFCGNLFNSGKKTSF